LIGVIDYGAGNLGSVMNALKTLSASARFVSGPEELTSSSSPFEKIIFPGDGHFAAAMVSLEKSGYAQAIKEWIKADKPFLGICIGLQLLFEYSEEANAAFTRQVESTSSRSPTEGRLEPPVNGKEIKGLCVIPGTVRRFPGRKVPQIGWNQTEAKPDSKIFAGIRDKSFFYYIHSYYADPADKTICAAETDYYVRYCCAAERGALSAVQFHPEKSGVAGLALLNNFLEG